MKKFTLFSMVFSLLVSFHSHAEHGVASGGGGEDQLPLLNAQDPGSVMLTCPGQSEIRCESASCLHALNADDELVREQYLRDACEESKSK